ncbi:venom allergen 5-like [Anabrus simplex]|uniref:venom allergen 5-like n=1 Tax=Anabrus simplex TaxID=316456 RepID=UPI0035A2D927
MKSLLCLLAVCTVVLATTKEEYCDTCPDEHAMCIYEGVSEACDADGLCGVSDSEKEQVVDLHNELRNKVAMGQERQGSPGPQPPASNMRKMTWDDGLAEVAQRWADQCDYGHDSCRNDPRFEEVQYHVGQNIAYDFPCEDGADWRVPIGLWYDEVADFDSSGVKCFKFDSGASHYTQLIWAETASIGCGFRTYTASSGECRRYYVCNYGPGGNYDDSPIYEEGDPRSSCPDAQFDSKYPGLC